MIANKIYQILIFLSFTGTMLFGQSDPVIEINFDAFANAILENYETLNTKYSEIAPYPMQNGLVFLQSEGKNEPYNLKYFDFEKDQVDPLEERFELPSSFHHGPLAYAAFDSTLFFSYNNSERDSKGKFQMVLASATFDSQAQMKIMDFPFNSVEYSILHPTVNRDGNVLVFSSNMPGGYGDTDLYLSTKRDSSWSDPVNLGPLVNTEGNDLFPFFYDNSWLFFSSDGREGYGGFDLYISQLKDGAFDYAENIGSPLNSVADDIGLVFLPDENKVVMSSNRDGGKGNDDLYNVFLSGPFFKRQAVAEDEDRPIKKFEIYTLNKNTNEPITGVSMFISEVNIEDQATDDLEDRQKFVVLPEQKEIIPAAQFLMNISDLNGKIDVALVADEVYNLDFKREGYKSHTLEFDTQKLVTEIYIFLEKE